MKKLDHSNVIDMVEIINDPNQEKIYMVTDYAENGAIMNWNEEKVEFELSQKL